MYVGEFSPADSVENEIYAFDFKRDLATGEVVESADFEISVIEGTDASASSRLLGPASVSGVQARQRVANLVPGVVYKLQAIVTTNQGNTKSLWGRVTCLI
jgi:hypothetical protein